MIIENSALRVEIAEHGAELMSIFDLRRNEELLWNGDKKYWGRRSPILFPYVGKTWQGRVLIDGEHYFPSAHGFARDMDFACEFANGASAVFLLKSNEDTLKVFPFGFELRVGYCLTETGLKVGWSVKNTSEKEMPFTIGGHPAFRFSGSEDSKENYFLEFELAGGKDALTCTLMDLSTGTTYDKYETVPLSDGRLPLSESLFDGDTLILDNSQIISASLYHKDGAHRVTVRCEGFPNFGIWSAKGAPFVCLEPWMGRCDAHGFDSELREKPDVNILAPGREFAVHYTIETL